MSYPDDRRIEFFDPEDGNRIEVDVSRDNGVWRGRAVWLSAGRMMSSPAVRLKQAPVVQQKKIEAGSYEALREKFVDYYSQEMGDEFSWVDSDYVNLRVQDWVQRVESFYELIEESIGGDFALERKNEVVMSEEMMRRFFIPDVVLDSLSVSTGGSLILLFKPKGLWVVGANGRIDLLSDHGSLIILDTSKYPEAPEWVAYSAKKNAPQAFDQQLLMKILNDGRL